MITEQDLRSALTRRVDTAPAFDPDRALAAISSDRPDAAPPRRNNRLAIAGAALSVVLAASAAAVLTDRSSSPAGAGHAAPTAAISTPASRTEPTSPASPTDGPPSNTPAGPPPPAIVRVRTDLRVSSVDRRPNVEFVTVQVGIMHTSVAGYRTGVFDASRVGHAVPVRIDGHPGLFGKVSVWPVNGRPDPSTGKQDAALPSLAWQLDRGPWVVLQIDTPLHPSKAQLLAAAHHVTVTAAH